MLGLDVGGLLGNMLNFLGKWWWIFLIIGILAVLIAVIWFFDILKRKKNQWTHKIRVQRQLQNGTLTPEVIHKARRFPMEQGVEMFELDKPILGSYLIPQAGEYTGINEFSIILDPNNRIYLNKGYKFVKNEESVNVSGTHAGIDVEMQNMKNKWQQAHKVEKRITTMELIQAGLKVLFILAIIIISVTALKEWGEAQKFKAESYKYQAEAMKNINEAVITMEKVVNTQQLQIIPMLKALYGDDNLVNEINKYCQNES